MAVLSPPGDPVGRSPVRTMRLYQTSKGIARADDGDELAVLDVPHPHLSALLSDTMVDYEGEIAVLIGDPGQDIPAGSGWGHIAGLCVANDISARDVQLAGMQNGRVTDIEKIIKGKTFPSFKPIGPCVVTVDDIKDCPLTLTTRVNGSQRQHADTSEMLFGFGQVVEQISATIELKSGDIILTGTPSGVGLADNRYLQAGDVVEVEVDLIGTLRYS